MDSFNKENKYTELRFNKPGKYQYNEKEFLIKWNK